MRIAMMHSSLDWEEKTKRRAYQAVPTEYVFSVIAHDLKAKVEKVTHS